MIEEPRLLSGLYLWRGISAPVRWLADRGVMVVHSIFHSGSLVHFYVGDGEDALPVSARNFAFIPVLIYSANQCNTLPLQAEKMTQTTHTHLFMYLVFLFIYIYVYRSKVWG